MSGPSQHQRAMSLLLVLLLHAFMLLVLLRFTVQKHSPLAPAEHLLEMIIPVAKVSAPAPRTPAQKPPTSPLPFIPPVAVPSLAPPTPDITGLGRALFGCAPENLSNLTQEHRAHCPSPFTKPDQSAMVEPKSHVKESARRAAEMDSKNTPGRVPCSFVAVERFTGAPVPAISFDCLADSVSGNGLPSYNGLSK
jgi:hypothetical protein